MYSRARKFLISVLIAAIPLSVLQAGRAFDVLHDHYREALEHGHIIRAINLYKPISMRTEDLRHQLLIADAEGNLEESERISDILQEYRKYLVTEEEAERMGVLRENTREPEKLKEASIFLYENTDFFRPTITIKDELGLKSQVHVWLAKPGTEITFEHIYDKERLEGRVFTGYRCEDGRFKKGEFPTFPMSFDSEVWTAIYEHGCILRDPSFDYEAFSPMDDYGFVRIPPMNWISSDYKLSGWMNAETGQVVAPKTASFIEINGNSMILEPLWEKVELDQLHLGQGRKNMKHGSKDRFYIDLTNESNSEVTFLVESSADENKVIAERVFEFVSMKPGESKTLGPYEIEALINTEKETVEFEINVKAVGSENTWRFTPNISLR